MRMVKPMERSLPEAPRNIRYLFPAIAAAACAAVACSANSPSPSETVTTIAALTGDGGSDAADGGTGTKTLPQLQSDYIDLRFGMFMHFGILTYTGRWAQANLDINQFNP